MTKDDGWIDDDESLKGHERGSKSRDEYGGASQQAKPTNALERSSGSAMR